MIEIYTDASFNEVYKENPIDGGIGIVAVRKSDDGRVVETFNISRRYRKAIFDLLKENLRNCDEYHSNGMDCYFKDHVKDKNGKLVECKAYFKREEN